jgi:mannosyltransferase
VRRVAAVAVPWRPAAGPRVGRPAQTVDAALVAVLTAASVALRAPGLGRHLWMDEGIAIGIASHPLTQIPGVLRLDGSPPLYYALLHAWMAVAGRSEVAVHLLSLVVAALCVPAAWCAGRAAVDRRTGAVLAALVACSPFLSTYARDARMYALVVLLGLLCTGLFASAYVRRRRRHRLAFGVALALALYTHNWALFLAAALVVALALVVRAAPRRERGVLVRDGVAGFGLAAALYLPWVPSLVAQARHTGAPWATRPGVGDLVGVPDALLGGTVAAVVLVLAAGAGLARERPPRGLAPALAITVVVPPVIGWMLSQATPAWTVRYLAIVLAPALLLAAAGLARAGRRAGVAALAGVAVLWAAAPIVPARSDAYAIARGARPLLRSGDLVVSTSAGQLPLLAYYLPRDLRFATAFGPARDTGVADWRDAVAHLRRTSVHGQLLPLLDRVRPGGAVLLVMPARGPAPTTWARGVHARAAAEERALRADPRFAPVAALPGPTGQPLRALVFRRLGS